MSGGGARRRALRALAERAGILPSYIDVLGRRRAVSDTAREGVLAAMGFDASTEAAAAAALAVLERRAAERLVAPVAVARGRAAALPLRLPPDARTARLSYALELTDESGGVARWEGGLPSRGGSHAKVPVPARLGAGYYTVRVAVRGAGREAAGEQLLIVPPRRCPVPAERLGRERGFGITVNLYALRSERNWGAGDFTDLARVVRWAGAGGAAFVGINPIHASLNRGDAISPYSPVSRLFRNPLYLDPVAAPEFADCAEARELAAASGPDTVLGALRLAPRLDYGRVMAVRQPVLDALYRRFADRVRDGGGERGRAYARYVAEQGAPLTDFATYLALAARHDPDWRRWPPALRRPDTAAVRAFRRAEPAEIERHCYVQFELDRQLRAAAATPGLEVGLLGDLAIGVAPSGSDPWAFGELFATGAHLGAPPDDYSPVGQNWGLAPIHPLRLVDDRCRYWVLLVRRALEHMGALRIDHVMGLFRQYWVPANAGPVHGAYVRHPAELLLAVLALEAVRRRAVVVGEDLGTVPRGLPATLARWGILSTRILYFERRRAGPFRPARRYSRRALVTVNTHDHALLAGYWAGRDLELRRAVGLIPDDRALAAARTERARTRRALLRRLAADGVLPAAREPESPDRLCGAVHTFLGRTPAPLVGLALDDLMGETEPMNLPGVGLDRYPSWTRRSRLTVEELETAPSVRRAWGDALPGSAGHRDLSRRWP